MYLGYNVLTDLPQGSVPVYDSDTNIGPDALTYSAVKSLSPDIQRDGSIVLVYPIQGSMGTIRTIDGEVSSESVPLGAVSPGIYVAEPISSDSIPPGATVRVIRIGAIPILAIVICIALCVIAVSAAYAVVGYYYNKAWASVEREKTLQEYYDYLVKTMEIVDEQIVDMNNDGTPDIRYVTWANGRVQAFALSDYGESILGGAFKVLDTGTVVDAPPTTSGDGGWTWLTTPLILLAVIIGGILALRYLKD